ncbi:stalk domain-containing protein [Desulfuribacillus alkaliarsenatis]|uniref:Copper amine oxidase-like N-terminal domain-containing protein n=1 Tax=Desulfuribacillus alkaliarsenatis TaxID=766136 RepID=A0A1E5FZJ6_9FIRM|nr:stalk domain-containing protein [Desulfuribacillus alkaliarsenatis]OEF95949.1 hypothetical protein BHF68_11205 [Desulfuribacillus alkaliarsenatis]
MKNIVRYSFAIIALILILTGNIYASEYQDHRNEWGLFLEGTNLNPDVAPIDSSSDLLLPIRFVVEGLGGEIEWKPHTKEVIAHVNGQELYIIFNHKSGAAHSVKVNGMQFSSKQHPLPVIKSGRTMINVELVELITKTKIARVDGLRLTNIYKEQKQEEFQLEQLALCVHKADEYLFRVFKDRTQQDRKQLESRLTRYYSKAISEQIIEHYYIKNDEGFYQVIPTDRPITIAPANNIESIELQSIKNLNNEVGLMLYVKRKPTLFSTYKVHSQYEFRLQNQQWIIVEIIHHLVDNRDRTNDGYGGAMRL